MNAPATFDSVRRIEAAVPAKFEPMFKPARYKGAHGGRGSAKSQSFGTLGVIYAVGKGARIVCIREVQNTIRDSVRQLLVDKIASMGLQDRFDVLESEIRGKDGGLFIFRGMKDMNAIGIQSLEGFDVAWVEEAQSLSQRSLDVLRPTIRKPGSELWFSWNPRFKRDPVDQFFRGPTKSPDAICVEMNWSDNPFLPNELLQEKNLDYLRDPVKAQHIWGGGYEQIAEGAYYGRDVVQAENENRITRVPHDRAARVFACWDLGIGDAMAIWTFQIVGKEWHWLHYIEDTSKPLGHYVDALARLPYAITEHLLPHDAEARELQTGKSRIQFLEELGLKCRVVPNHRVDDGIEAVRNVFNRFWIDADNCERGIECARNYRAEFDPKMNTIKSAPRHDEFSHGADAMRIGVMGINEQFISTQSDWSKPISRTGGGVA
jgi:phage terminase large subunit